MDELPPLGFFFFRPERVAQMCVARHGLDPDQVLENIQGNGKVPLKVSNQIMHQYRHKNVQHDSIPKCKMWHASVATVMSHEQQIQCVRELGGLFQTDGPYRLIVVDSLMHHFRNEFSGRGREPNIIVSAKHAVADPRVLFLRRACWATTASSKVSWRLEENV